MKTRKTTSVWIRRHTDLRRLGGVRSGYSLITVLINMTILSSLLGTCGVCLHTLFRLDHKERVTSQMLVSLRRMERQLREDCGRGTISSDGGQWRIHSAVDDEVIVWSESRGLVQREVFAGGEPRQRERFVFPAGTRVEFSDPGEGSAVVRVREGSVFVRYPEAGDGGAVRNKPESVALPSAPAGMAKAGEIEIQLQHAFAANGDSE